ncbi:MAG TPA: shikimate dehydrogenase [Methanomicrobiales archaeon]|nr:shikimate dehydrogenase [Methanomicrobiales archaeon]
MKGRRIILTGFRGTGKTSSGKLLAEMLGMPFLDTDRVIEERAGKRIPAIFRERGEPAFRELEREAIASLPAENVVVGTGGGAVLDPVNVERLKRGSVVFLLQAGEGTIVRRIGGSDRPSLTGKPPAEEVGELLRERQPAYLRAADFCIDAGGDSAGGVAEEMARILREGPSSRLSRDAGMQFIGKLLLPPGNHDALSAMWNGAGGRPAGSRTCGCSPPAGLCAIAGYPCSHSKSPALWNGLFNRYGLPYLYTSLEWPDIAGIMQAVRNLGIRGLSVTIPFKETVIAHLDGIDPDARAIGAVNTVVQCGGVLRGYNTDWLGIREPLRDLRGARAAVLGAGGAAAAAVYALLSLDMEVTVLNRTPEKAERLAGRFGCRAGPLSSIRNLRPDVVVNATPVGMHPDRSSLLSGADLVKGMTVFDLVYTPPETPLLALARSAGCRVVPGTEMFIHQAREQFFHVTGIRVPEPVLRELV